MGNTQTFVKIGCPDCSAPMRRRDGKYGPFFGCSAYPKCKGTRSVSEVQRMVQEAKQANKPVREFKPSKYQLRVFDFILNRKGHAVVEAVAGSGKTTTIVKALGLTDKGDKVLFCAFNRHIADELKLRAPKHVRVGTLHSIGFAALREHLTHRPEVDGNKLWNICKELMPDEEDYPLRAPLKRLVSLAKATLVDVTNVAALEQMAARYEIELNGDAERLLSLVPAAMAMCLERTHVIDYDDMIWIPVILGLNMSKYDWVFIDEAQDLNASQIELVLGLINGTGRIIAVGDRCQSIYGFRGADTSAIPNLIAALDAKVLPLSITYRCPTTHVELAKKLVPQIEAAEWAKEGEIHHINYYNFKQAAKEGDLVLCRINAPLVKACYSLIRTGHKAIIRGRDVGRSLQTLVDRLKPTDIHDLLHRLRDYKWMQGSKLEAAGKDAQAMALKDRCDTLEALCEGVRDLTELRHNIDTIFNDITREAIVLSSVHRAKGDEADRVFILHPELMPHPLASQPWQLQQESNIEYVAYTRSLSELIFVEG